MKSWAYGSHPTQLEIEPCPLGKRPTEALQGTPGTPHASYAPPGPHTATAEAVSGEDEEGKARSTASVASLPSPVVLT
jgi:hypothetical protein